MISDLPTCKYVFFFTASDKAAASALHLVPYILHPLCVILQTNYKQRRWRQTMCNTGGKEQTQSEWAQFPSRSQPRFWCLLASAKKDTGQENILVPQCEDVSVPGAQTRTRACLTPKVRFKCSSLQVPCARAACPDRLVKAVLDAGVGNNRGSKTRKWGDVFLLVLHDKCCSGKSKTLELLGFIDIDSSSPIARYTLNGTKRKQKQPLADEFFPSLCLDWWLAWQNCAGLSTNPGMPAPLPACLPAWAGNKSGRWLAREKRTVPRHSVRWSRPKSERRDEWRLFSFTVGSTLKRLFAKSFHH